MGKKGTTNANSTTTTTTNASGKGKRKRVVPADRTPSPDANGQVNTHGRQQKKSKTRAHRKQARVASATDAGATDDGGADVDVSTLSFSDALAVGMAFQQLGVHDSAVEAFVAAVAQRPTHYGALTQLADAQAELGATAEAWSLYERASQCVEAADDASLWLRLGMVASHEEAQAPAGRAVECLQKARAMAEQALQQKEQAGAEEEKTEETAVQRGEEAEEMEARRRTYGMALAALANAVGGETGDVNAAAQIYRDAVTVFPRWANLHFNLAAMLLAGEQRMEACLSLKRAIECDPDVVEFYEELVECLSDGEEKEEYAKRMAEVKGREGVQDRMKHDNRVVEEEEEEEEEEEVDDEEEQEEEEEESSSE